MRGIRYLLVAPYYPLKTFITGKVVMAPLVLSGCDWRCLRFSGFVFFYN